MIADTRDPHVCAVERSALGAAALPFVDINDQRIWYDGVGDSEAPAILLVHGAGESLAAWDVLTAALAPAFHVVRFDLPGHGASPAPDDAAAFGFDRLAELTAALLDSLGIRRTYLCGEGIGGILALLLAIAAPDRLHGLILVDTAPQPLPESLRAAVQRGLGMGLPAGAVPATEEGRPAAEGALLRAWAAFGGLVERLETVTVETLVLVRDDAPAFLQDGAELLHGWMPFSRLTRVARGGSQPPAGRAGELETEILGFLQEVEAFCPSRGAAGDGDGRTARR